MATTFNPTESKILFLGRELDMDSINQVLDREKSEWIIHIPGPGGIGKTRLLEQVLSQVEQRSQTLVTKSLIDFYKTSVQTEIGLLRELARQLGPHHFPHFMREANSYSGLGDRNAISRLIKQFLIDYVQLLKDGYKIVLLCDTDENMYGVQHFFLEELLTKIHQCETDEYRAIHAEENVEQYPPEAFQTVVLVAGREEINFPEQLRSGVLRIELQPLKKEHICEFFIKGEIALTNDQLDQLYNRTGGRPLYVALCFDWLKNEVGTIDDLFSTSKRFGEHLVEWVYRLPVLQKQIILDLAIAWRRMEPSLLAKLLQVSVCEVENQISELNKFSFIKYRPPSEDFPGSFLLHDEMRRLVNDHIWPKEGKFTREALLRQVIEWYQEHFPEGFPECDELYWEEKYHVPAAEWLFYKAQLNLEEAFNDFGTLFKNASYRIVVDFSNQVNQEIVHFEHLLREEQLDELRFRQALVLFRKEDFKQARDIWLSLLRRPNYDKKMKATINMMLTEVEGYSGAIQQALIYASESERLYNEVIEEGIQKDQAQKELGQLYNNLGYIYRVMNDLDKAREYYERALNIPSRAKNTARTLNNLGYIHFLQGDMNSATTYVSQSIQIRKQLKIAYELGLGYNTLGMIMESEGRIDEAVDHFNNAINQFETVKSDHGKALVLTNLGRMRRHTNDFPRALDDLTEAKEIFMAENNQDYLSTALNELGCVYRSRGENGDWEEAEKNFIESLRICQELKLSEKQADNFEDLSMLYYRRVIDAMRCQNQEAKQLYFQKSLEMYQKVQEVADPINSWKILGKNELTFGNLCYLEKNYDGAFEGYFRACLNMARAYSEGKYSRTKVIRQYHSIVDRIQEQLQALPDLQLTVHYADQLLEKRDSLTLSSDGATLLTKLWESLEATRKLANLMARTKG